MQLLLWSLGQGSSILPCRSTSLAMTMHSRRWISQFRLWRLALRSVGGGQELVVAAPGGVRLGSAEDCSYRCGDCSWSRFVESVRRVGSWRLFVETVPGVQVAQGAGVVQGVQVVRGAGVIHAQEVIQEVLRSLTRD